MHKIVEMKFGSHLYGTNTPESDIDIKGVFMPEPRDIGLGKIPKSINFNTKKGNEEGVKNTSEDVDSEFYSLHYFIKLACEGQTVALDMLHAPNEMLIETSPIWNEIISMRELFYTKNLKAFVGYARKQAAKYGVKGSRLNDVQRVVDSLEMYRGDTKLYNIWNVLPEGEHIYKLKGERYNHTTGRGYKLRVYEVCGRKVQETCTVDYAYGVFNRYLQNYGKRAEQAAKNEGIDWKAISHAIRAAMQVRELLQYGTITFPLVRAEVVKKIKAGELDYMSEVAPLLEKLIEEVEELSLTSKLPEKADTKFWDDWLWRKVRLWIREKG